MKSDVIVTHGHEEIIDTCCCFVELLAHPFLAMSQVKVHGSENADLTVRWHSEI
jgi:hypothetical protein